MGKLMRKWLYLAIFNNEGKGSKPQPPTIIQPPPPQIIPGPVAQPISNEAVRESSRQLAESQLEFNPKLAQQAFELFQQYAPRTAETQAGIQRGLAPGLAQSEYEIARQYTPLYRALYEQTFPTQTAAQEALTGQSLQQILSATGLTPQQQAAQLQARQQAGERVPSTFLPSLTSAALQQFASPTGMTPAQQAAELQARQAGEAQVPSTFQGDLAQRALEQFRSPTGVTSQQQAAIDAIRQRQMESVQRNIRESANVGGGLYGGQRQLGENRALTELAQGYAAQDIDLQERQRQQALQQLLAASGQEQGLAAQRQAFGLQNVGLQRAAQQSALQQLMAAAGQEQGIAAQRQAFGLQDVGLQQMQRQQALQNLTTGLQVAFPQIQQPGAPGGFVPPYQSVTPSPDALLQAVMQQSGNYIAQQPWMLPGTPGSPGFFGSFTQGYTGGRPGY